MTTVTEDIRKDLQRLWGELAQQRDEIRVRLHLAKAEVRDEFEDLEKKWERARLKLDQLRAMAGEVSGEVGAAARQLLEEVKRGQERLRKAI